MLAADLEDAWLARRAQLWHALWRGAERVTDAAEVAGTAKDPA
ncbi:hypothetical protein [Streptomyces sp. TRM70350]|nr:hypothetical protein [Streptomyces sp. TRM70350]